MTTAPPKLLAYLAQQPGRCAACGWHEKQGHAPSCADQLAQRRAVVDSVAHDWRADPDWQRFVEACAAVATPEGIVHVGAVRRRLSNSHGLMIQPRRLSAFWQRATSKDGFLRFHSWEQNDDHTGKNAGKPQRVYAYRSAA